MASDRWFLGWFRPLFERSCPFCALLSSMLLFASLWAPIFLRFWLPKSVQNRPKIDAKTIIDKGVLCSSFCNSFFQHFLLHGATANLQKVLFFRWFFNVFTFRHQRPQTNHPMKILLKISSILTSKIDPNGIGNRSSNQHRLQNRICIVLKSILGRIWMPFGRLLAFELGGPNLGLLLRLRIRLASAFEAPRRPCP